MQLGFLTGAADSELRPQARTFGWVVLWSSVEMSRPRKPEAGPRVSEDFMCDLHMRQLDEKNTECQPFSFTRGFRGGGRW